MKRSQSCAVSLKRPSTQSLSSNKDHLTPRRFSLSNIRNRSSSNKQPEQNHMDQFKQKIVSYIDSRSDVQIISFYTEYREEFFRKSINLQNLFYQQPQLRQKYLNESEDLHFLKGFQHTLLTLFRKGVIVPGEYKKMRQQTVEEIQKWVFSWIKRKKNYQKAVQKESNAQQNVLNIVDEINSWAKQMKEEKPFF